MKWFFIIVIIIVAGWKAAVYLVNKKEVKINITSTDTLQAKQPVDTMKTKEGLDTIAKNHLTLPAGGINTKSTQPQQIVDYAKTLIGVPYLYGSTDPAKGFDCSGFITYVFNHYNIAVPRSSIDFTNVGREVSAADAKPADLILFTGTDSSEKFVGHMGIVVFNADTLRFIHSTSGKIHEVTITALNAYYQKRYVKIVRVFP